MEPVAVLRVMSEITQSNEQILCTFRRPHAAELARRLAEPRRFIQVVAGARQVGRTTLVQQVTDAARLPLRFDSADEPTLRGAADRVGVGAMKG